MPRFWDLRRTFNYGKPFFLQILGGRDVPHYVAVIKSGQNPGKMATTL